MKLNNVQRLWRPFLCGAGALLLAGTSLLPATAQEEIDATVAAVGTVANDGPLPSGGEALAGAEPLARMEVRGPEAAQVSLERVAVAGQPFSEALRVRVPKIGGNGAAYLAVDIPDKVSGGDVMFLRLWGRVVEGGNEKGEASPQISVQSKAPRFSVFFGGRVTFGREWRRFDLPVRAWRSFGAGQGELAITLDGNEARTLEFAGLEAFNYRGRVATHQLPFKRSSYEGREKNAPWRAEAAARIEKHRKGDLVVQVVDRNGRPLSGARVQARMTRHAYGFGTAVANGPMLDKGPLGARYRAEVKRLFNTAVIENGLKWNNWERPQERAGSLEILRLLNANGITVRGHTAVYPRFSNAPAPIEKLFNDTKAAQGEAAAKDALRGAIDKHIADKVGATRGLVIDWDAVNETIGRPDMVRILGRDEIVRWFQKVRDADPNAVLYLNENSVENGSKTAAFEDELQFLLDKGAPLGGIGLQGHVGALAISTAYQNITRFSKFKLPIKITEFDIVTPDEGLQADYMRDFLTLIFSIPETEAFLMWGFWDGAQWLGDAPIFYKDWTLKPSGKAYEDLVLKQWWTSVAGQTDRQGQAKARGFLGDYQITVSHGGRSQTVPATLTRAGQTVLVKLP